jgi:large subunit ribosomal protein L30
MAKTTAIPKAPKVPKAQKKERPVSSVAPAVPLAPVVTPAMGKTLTVTLLRSTIGKDRKQGAVVRGLGLRRIRHTVEVPDTPATRGMLHKVRHLVEVRG